MAQVKVIFGADGKKNGTAWTINMCSGSPFETVIVDASRWHHQIHSSNESIQAFLLGVLRNKYPEVEWTRAFVVETRSV